MCHFKAAALIYMVSTVSGIRENSEGQEKSGNLKVPGVQKITKDAGKNFELLYADCATFEVFPVRFAHRLFVPPLLNLSRRLFSSVLASD